VFILFCLFWSSFLLVWWRVTKCERGGKLDEGFGSPPFFLS